jgi:hypothetical protein
LLDVVDERIDVDVTQLLELDVAGGLAGALE